jgi:hypothetical protein
VPEGLSQRRQANREGSVRGTLPPSEESLDLAERPLIRHDQEQAAAEVLVRPVGILEPILRREVGELQFRKPIETSDPLRPTALTKSATGP